MQWAICIVMCGPVQLTDESMEVKKAWITDQFLTGHIHTKMYKTGNCTHLSMNKCAALMSFSSSCIKPYMNYMNLCTVQLSGHDV